MTEKCISCTDKESTDECLVCGNMFCEECLESHEHCNNCHGTGVDRWNICKNLAGELDYQYGEPTGEVAEESCRCCDGFGISF
jgi:hypothetical protein